MNAQIENEIKQSQALERVAQDLLQKQENFKAYSENKAAQKLQPASEFTFDIAGTLTKFSFKQEYVVEIKVNEAVSFEQSIDQY